ncbi:MAG: hypothetical protein ACNS62_00655 [Candidatus Cyclobacteriaceae bacterium M3_2C_046]
MFSFFRINDPYRIIIIFILLVLLTLPFFLGGLQLTLPELNWMIIGEKLSNAGVLYVDVWDDIGPFSAVVYWLIDELFGRSLIAYKIIGLLLVIIQSTLFNSIMLSHKAYNENSYVPALIYMILMTGFFDFFTLSPILMSLTFILLAVSLLLAHIESWQKQDERILKIGIFMGIAVLFFFPAFILFVVVIFAFLFFTGTSIRRNLLFLYGFVLPFGLVWLYYYWQGGSRNFLIDYVYATFLFKGIYFIDIPSFLIISSVPIIFLLLALVKVFGRPGFTNFQVRIQQIMFLQLVLSFFALMLTNQKAPYQLAIFVPPTAFFLTHYFLLIRKKIWLELQFGLFFIFIILISWGTYYEFFITHRWINYEKLLTRETPLDEFLQDKKILVIGQDLNLYKNARLATPYLDWKLSQMHLTELGYYDNLTAIYRNFVKDPPQVIIDQENIMPLLFEKIPVLEMNYQKTSRDQIYTLSQDEFQSVF